MSNKLTLPVSMFGPWKSILFSKIKEALDNAPSYQYNKVLGHKSVREELNKLKEDFIFSPVDKASCNTGVICKFYYCKVLENELECSGNFIEVSTTVKDVITESVTYMKDNKFYIPSTHYKLPFIYWTPKMHKNPVGSRFITSSRNTSNSKISTYAGIALKTLLKADRNKSRYDSKYQNFHKYFIIDNRDNVIKYIKETNTNNNQSKSVKSYDFSNLYTSIPHSKLIETITKFVEKVFHMKGKKYLVTNSKYAYFSNRRGKSGLSFSSEELIRHVKFIVGNSYVCYKGKVYRQTVGIPMGTNCAPYLANIFLHVYEYSYIDNCIANGDSDIPIDLNGLFRYQDDCIVFNDNGTFQEHIEDIYPNEMTLKCTNLKPATCNYLDLTVSVYRGTFNYRSYDKRRDFDFEVVNYPDLSGNVPFKPSYGIFSSQLVRFCNVNKTAKYFSEDIKTLVKKLCNQGFNIYNLKSKYLEFAKNKIPLWSRFGVDITEYKYMRYIFKL